MRMCKNYENKTVYMHDLSEEWLPKIITALGRQLVEILYISVRERPKLSTDCMPSPVSWTSRLQPNIFSPLPPGRGPQINPNIRT